MPSTIAIPPHLRAQPFTTAAASRHGLSRSVLAGSRFRSLFRGVWIAVDVELTFRTLLVAARLTLPCDVVVSHTSAMRLYGIEPRAGRHRALEFSTNTAAVTRHRGVRLHRREGRLTPFAIDDFDVTGPDRTFVDCAGCLSFVELVQLGDWLIHTGHTTLDTLADYVTSRHLHGVRRARLTLGYLRERVESPMETVLRLMIVCARLPEPACNVDIHADDGQLLGRGDLVFARWKVLVEYDGWHHERDAVQRRSDIRRRERLEAAGWIIIVVTVGDLGRAREIPWRVYRPLKARDYDGPAPMMNIMWDRWFR